MLLFKQIEEYISTIVSIAFATNVVLRLLVGSTDYCQY